MPLNPDSFKFPPGWRPEPGEIVAGRVREISTFTSAEYGTSPAVHLDLQDGCRARLKDGDFTEDDVTVFIFGEVLESQFRSLNIQPGDEEIAVLYKGKTVSENTGREYRDWRVRRLNGDSPTYDWGSGPQDPRTPLNQPLSDVPADTKDLEREEDGDDIPF